MDEHHERERFRSAVWGAYRREGRKLPWRLPTGRRGTYDPYRILVSEFMLQQTQVTRVIPKHEEFLRAFPSIRALARAPLRAVLRAWSGLGYNRRALSLHALAKVVLREHGGRVPRTADALNALPGVGRSTAGAVLAFAWNIPVPFIETNIRRAFLHWFFPERRKVRDEEIQPLVEQTLDRRNPREWCWALMDYGAMLRKMVPNPNRRSAGYARQPPFAGSNRELRGKILTLLTKSAPLAPRMLRDRIGGSSAALRRAIRELSAEGFIRARKDLIAIR